MGGVWVLRLRAKAKLFTTEMAVEVANKALQVHEGTELRSNKPEQTGEVLL